MRASLLAVSLLAALSAASCADEATTEPGAGDPVDASSEPDAGAGATASSDAGSDEGGSDAESPASPTHYVLSPIEDTYVRSDLPSTNQGSNPTMVVHTSAPPVISKHALLRFRIGAGQITRAVLRLYSTNGSSQGLEVYKASTATWKEMGATLKNTSPFVDTRVATSPPVPTNGWLEVDLTNVVKANETLTLRLSTPSSDGVVLNSKEAADNRPSLSITTADRAPRTCAAACATGEVCAPETGLCGCTPTSCGAGLVCGVTGQCAKRLKIMQFNILEGAVGNMTDGVAKVDAVAATIQAVQPDVVSINEANSAEVFATLATKTGMTSKLCLAPNGYHVGVLTRVPFTSSQCVAQAPLTKAVTIVAIPAGGKTLDVFATHLTATTTAEDIRVSEIQAVLALAASKSADARVIIGDLNSFTAGDGTGGKVTPVLTDAQYVDTYREVHPGFTGYRIDYIFHDSSFVRATTAEILKNREPWPSDHPAVWGTFEVAQH